MKKYTVIEVGGNYGNDTQRYSEIENSLVWCFEPVPALFDKLFSLTCDFCVSCIKT